jgi:hypothetical protein
MNLPSRFNASGKLLATAHNKRVVMWLAGEVLTKVRELEHMVTTGSVLLAGWAPNGKILLTYTHHYLKMWTQVSRFVLSIASVLILNAAPGWRLDKNI